MPDMYRVNLRTGEISCDTAQEAIALTAQFAGRSPGTMTPTESAPLLNGYSPAEASRRSKMAKQALMFLEAVKAAGNTGVGGEALAKKIGASGVSGIGAVVLNLNKFLKPHGLKTDDVAERRREGNDKLWSPRRQIDDAIGILTKQISELKQQT